MFFSKAFPYFFIILNNIVAQKIVLVVVDGFGGSIYHRFSHMPGLRTFEEEGVWSTKLLSVFPTLPLPTRHSLMTGVLPRRHGLIGDYMLDSRTGATFNNFTEESDFDRKQWWAKEPIYITATKQRANVAMFFFPECKVDWVPSLAQCVPPRKGKSFTDDASAKAIVAATKFHDLVMVYHPNIRIEHSKLGPRRVNERTTVEVDKFQQSLERLTSQARERLDLNVIVVSTHGLADAPRRNIRFLEDYLPIDSINTTVGSGAVKQILTKKGKTHQVFTHLRYNNSIPNVKIYYTASKVGDLPEWYNYKRSSTISDLVLIAQPGFGITTRNETKQFPKSDLQSIQNGMSGYNNEYPDMLGIFLAYGPRELQNLCFLTRANDEQTPYEMNKTAFAVFRKGYRKGTMELLDIYHLMCNILEIGCQNTPRRLVRIDDILTSDARVAMRAGFSSAAGRERNSHIYIIILLVIVAMISEAFLSPQL